MSDKILILDHRVGNYDDETLVEMREDAHIVLTILADETIRAERGGQLSEDEWRDMQGDKPEFVFANGRTEAEISMCKADADKARRQGGQPAVEHDRESSMTKVFTALGTDEERASQIMAGDATDPGFKSDPRQKHDDACMRRKATHPHVCTCGMTDAQVVAATNGRG